MSPCEHLVQIYEDDDSCLDSLQGFVEGGLRLGEAVVVIATAPHLASLATRLEAAGWDMKDICARNQYIPLDAEQTLSKFVIDGWPDEYLFIEVVSDIIHRAGKGGRRVRAFGEMVAVLWAQGHHTSTVRLEHLWNRLCQQRPFPVFCAYPKSGFSQCAGESIRAICATHSQIISE